MLIDLLWRVIVTCSIAVNCITDTEEDFQFVNITLTYNSANTARLQWQLSDNNNINTGSRVTEGQLIQERSRCGNGKSFMLQNRTENGEYYDHIIWGVNSSVGLTFCIRTKTETGSWSEWLSVYTPPARKEPPLLTRDLEGPNLKENLYSYTATASCTGSPAPRWRWVINNEQFNRTQKLPRQYGSYSRVTDTHQLVISGFDKIADKELALHYDAENKYGAVRSRTVVITKPYIYPEDGNSWDLDYMKVINYTSGIVLKCSSYEHSWPPMSHSWHYCGSDSCAQLGSISVKHCPQITDFSERKFLVEEGKKLVFAYMTKEDSGCYVCQSENAILMEILRSTVTLVTQLRSLEYSPKLVHQYPSSDIITVVLGTTLRLECAFQANPVAQVTWYHNNTLILNSDTRRKIQQYGNILTINNVLHSDEGMYKCVGTSTSISFQDFQDQGLFRIHVDVKPRIVSLESQSGYIGDNVTLFCNTAYNSHIRWYKNIKQELEELSANYSLSEDKKMLTLYDIQLSDTGTYTCKAINRHGTDVKHATVVVLEPVKVSLIKSAVYKHLNITMVYLSCDVRADVNQDLTIKWSLDRDTCQGYLIDSDTDTSDIKIFIDTDSSSAIETCIVYCYGEVEDMTSCRKVKINPLGGVIEEKACSELFTPLTTIEMDSYTNMTSGDSGIVPTLPNPRLSESTGGARSKGEWLQDNHYVIIGVSLVAALLIAGSVIVVYQYHRQRKTSRSGPRLADYGSGGLLLGPVQYLREDRLRMGFVNNSLYTTNILGENLKNQLREVEIPRKNLTLGEMIGRGQFGRVYKGTLDDKSYMNTNGTLVVAIKTLKYKADESDMVELFLREALMMKGFDHPHVLSLIGITMDTDLSPLVVLPFMDRGDLRTYISSPDLDFRVIELLKMGVQVANGMAYLSGKRFVHRDLAARNCMVDKQGIVKVADFGLSRDLYSQEYYRTEDGKNPLPIRWMAIESLDKKIFTTKSDVWSFGVLLWELVTRGATPYPGIENWALAQHIQQGGRMKQPLYCPNSVYEIMLECWNKSPKLRPTFEVLQARLEAITATSDADDIHNDKPKSKLERRSTLDMDIRTTKVTKCRVAKDRDLSVLDES